MQKDILILDYLHVNPYSLEYILYSFYNNYKLKYDVLDKMSLIWYDTYANKEHLW